jgi:dihydrofolate reductase
MRQLILQMQISIDGFVGGPNGELDWIFKSTDESLTHWEVEHLWEAGVHIMGRRTFQDMASYWPTSTEPFAAPMNEIPKIVFTRKGFDKTARKEVTTAVQDAIHSREEKGSSTAPDHSASIKSWDDATVVVGQLEEEIKRLKQQPGKIILAHGGAGFARDLVRSGFVDVYRLVVHPVALAKGLPLFSSLPEISYMKLVNATVFDSGAVAHIYRPA